MYGEFLIGTLLRIIGYCIIGGGLSLSYYLGDPVGLFSYFDWGLALPVLIGSIISGVFIIGISEIINLLSSINNKMK